MNKRRDSPFSSNQTKANQPGRKQRLDAPFCGKLHPEFDLDPRPFIGLVPPNIKKVKPVFKKK